MRKYLKILILFFFLFTLFGCTKYHVEDTIGENNSFKMTIKQSVALDGDCPSGSNSCWVSSRYANAPTSNIEFNNSVKIENEDVDDEYLYREYTFDNINDLCSDSDVQINLQDYYYDSLGNVSQNGIFKCENKGDRIRYTANFIYIYKSYYQGYWIIPSDPNGEYSQYYSYALDGADLSYTFNLGDAVLVSSNATSVSNGNKRLFWELEGDQENELSFVFDILNPNLNIDYNENDIEEITTDVVSGTIVEFKTKSGRNIKDIQVLDEYGTEINYNKIDNNEYYFIMPDKNVTISTTYYDNHENQESTIKIVDVSIEKDENDRVNINPTFNSLNINSNITFRDVGDEVIYKIQLNNSSEDSYKIKSILDTNGNEYVSYNYSYDNKTIKPGDNNYIYLTIKYDKDHNGVYDNLDNVSLNILLNNTKSLVPKTIDRIVLYLALFLLSIIGFVFSLKNNKLYFILLFIMIPILHADDSLKITININNNLKIKENGVYCYIDDDIAKGFEYTNRQFTYTYNKETLLDMTAYIANKNNRNYYLSDIDNGWGVSLTEKETGEYITSKICTYINDEPVTSMSYLFSNIKSDLLDLSNYNTSNIKNMAGMFLANNVENINLSNFDTSNVKNMDYMFYKNEKLINLNMKNNDLSKLESANDMFSETKKLEKIITPKVMPSFEIVFYKPMYDKMEVEYLSLFNDTPKNILLSIKSEAMFLAGRSFNQQLRTVAGCSTDLNEKVSYIYKIQRSLEEVPPKYLSSTYIISTEESNYPIYAWRDENTIYYYSKAKTIYLNPDSSNYFYNFNSLNQVDILDNDFSQVTNINSMFSGCSSLVELNFGNIDFSNIDSAYNPFHSMTALKYFITPKVASNISINLPKNLYDESDDIYSVLNSTTPVSTLLTVERIAVLDTGKNIIFKVKKLSKETSSYQETHITKIVRSQTEPNIDGMTEYNSFEYIDSYYPIYAWYEDGILYYYSEAETIYLNSNCSNMFEYIKNVETIDLSNINATKLSNANHMFYGCEKLVSLDLSGFSTPKLSDTQYMFSGCKSLERIVFGNTFDTSHVGRMDGMFFNCTSLISLDLSNLDLSNVTITSSMLNNCSALGELYTPKAIKDGITITLPKPMYDAEDNSYSELTSTTPTQIKLIPENIARLHIGDKVNSKFLKLASNDLSNIQNIIRSNTAPDLNNITDDNIISVDRIPVYAWYENGNMYYYSEAQTIYLNENSNSLFSNMSSINELDLSNFDTSKVTNMSNMFSGCSNITSLDLSNLDMSKVTSLSNMLSNMTKLSRFKTPKIYSSELIILPRQLAVKRGSNVYFIIDNISSDVETQTWMEIPDFAYLDTGSNLNVKFKKLSGQSSAKYTTNNSAITNIQRSMTLPNNIEFTEDNIISAGTINIYAWFDSGTIYYYSPTAVIYLNYDLSNMFNYFSKLTEVDLSAFDTSYVRSLDSMFYRCASLTTVYVAEKWSTANVITNNNLFYNCTKLVGGSGTTYTSSLSSNLEYARVDKKVYDSETSTWIDDESKPGLFTLKSNNQVVMLNSTKSDKNINFYNSF